jgi:hypothetical protein
LVPDPGAESSLLAGPAMSKGKEKRRMAQERRLQAALRENLKRRKAQARGRFPAGKTAPQEEPGEGSPGKPPDNERPDD